jgi:Ni,Fe-hydrogenase III large subunit/Ni,Fe-hydrogenase III component G
MDSSEIISCLKASVRDFSALSLAEDYADEICVQVKPMFFKDACLTLHKSLHSPIMMLFASDEREKLKNFLIHCVFLSSKNGKWITVSMSIPQDDPCFDSLAKSIYSASLFERQIWEMFGIEPKGNPDLRRLNLHDEVWPRNNFPLRKDFKQACQGYTGEYKFGRVEGEGIFEVPVGPVHAGIIGPGHFRFSVAGEPIINLETRLGFTHRGVEKLFEGLTVKEAQGLAERISGDSSFAHSLSFVRAAEKISKVAVPVKAELIRGVFLELERMYNHANDIGGMAIDVGFSFPAGLAAIIKEAILQLNESLCASRYLKGVNILAGVIADIDERKKKLILGSLKEIKRDFSELGKILNSSVSFMDRVDTTGVLKKKTAEDLGITGLAARASGIPLDLRKYFSGVYQEEGFKMAIEQTGDVLARLRIRLGEFEESTRLIEGFLSKITPGEKLSVPADIKNGNALGYTEAWRGPVLYWLKTQDGLVERCKIVEASFHNWQGLSYAVLGNIIPDFPLCNKSFDLSYSGNDL